MIYAVYVSTYLLEFAKVIKLLLCLQFLKSNLQLNTAKYSYIQLYTVQITEYK
jgi:hypothetical protein